MSSSAANLDTRHTKQMGIPPHALITFYGKKMLQRSNNLSWRFAADDDSTYVEMFCVCRIQWCALTAYGLIIYLSSLEQIIYDRHQFFIFFKQIVRRNCFLQILSTRQVLPALKKLPFVTNSTTLTDYKFKRNNWVSFSGIL